MNSLVKGILTTTIGTVTGFYLLKSVQNFEAKQMRVEAAIDYSKTAEQQAMVNDNPAQVGTFSSWDNTLIGYNDFLRSDSY